MIDRHLSFDAYRALPGLNWSSLKVMHQSPAHYRAALDAPREDTPALILGRATHTAILEAGAFDSRYVVYDGIKRGKAWDEFSLDASCDGREVLSRAEWTLALAMQRATRSDPAIRYVVGGQAEVSMAATLPDGTEAKGRADCIHPDYGIVDLKTTLDASPRGFAASCARYLYHCQAAYYVDIYRAATGKDAPFTILAVEKKPPHVVEVYRVPESALDVGRYVYLGLLERLRECEASGVWPGYGGGKVLDLELPAWATPYDDEDDVGDLGLVFSADKE